MSTDAEPSDEVPRSSDHLVRMIDVLYALVLGQGVLLFKGVWQDPLNGDFLTAELALLTVYYTVIRSFVGWHLTMDKHPYKIVGAGDQAAMERWRVYVDLVIALLYAYLLVNAHVLVGQSGADIGKFLIGFPLIFGGYVAWGMLRRRAYPGARWPLAEAGAGVACLAVLLVYVFVPPPGWLDEGPNQNQVAVVSILVLTMLFRIWNWRGARETWRSEARRAAGG